MSFIKPILLLALICLGVAAQDKQAAELYNAAQSAHQKGDFTKAVELYTEALKQDPELWQAEFQRGSAYFSLSKFADAKNSLDRVLKQLADYGDTPDVKAVVARIQILLGEIALAEAKLEDAEKAFRRAFELNPQAARARAGLSEVFLAANKHEEAITEANAAIAAGDDRAAAFVLLGLAQTLSGKFVEAVPSLTEALKRDPKNTLALLYRAEALIAQNKSNEAIADLRLALQLDPQTRTKLRLAAAWAQSKQHADALALYQDALKAEPENNEARTAVAALLIETGKGAEAIAQLESLIKAEPDHAALRAQLAVLYLPTNPDKALEQYLAAAKLEPTKPSHQIGIGSALVKLKRFPEAVAALRPLTTQSLKEDVAYFAHTNLATALFELDDFANAAREFVWLLSYQQKRGEQKRLTITLYFLGICLDKLGDYEQALRAYQQFQSLATAENQLEVEKVKLRMPSLQRQIREGKNKRK